MSCCRDLWCDCIEEGRTDRCLPEVSHFGDADYDDGYEHEESASASARDGDYLGGSDTAAGSGP